jgi:phage terminase large subunit-like protein
MSPSEAARDILASWITIDPAFGESAATDLTAIVVHVLPKDGVAMVAEHIHCRMREHEMFENTLLLAYKWGAWTWGIEAVAAQKVLITLFQVMLTTKRLNHHVEMLPLISGAGDAKVARISAFVALMESQEYAIPEDDTEIVTQMMAYNMKKRSNKDDLIDSCAYGPIMMDQYLPLIMEQYSGGLDNTYKTRIGSEVYDV